MMPLVGESMDFKKKIKVSPELNQLNLFITYVRLFLLITLPCSPGVELRRVQLTGIGRMLVKGASKAAAKRSCMIPEHSTQARCY